MMTYKEALFFTGKCLTISHIEKNKLEIEKELQSNTIDWEAIVKISSAHFVLPALFCKLKQTQLLNYLPNDLVEFMTHITNLNRDRNKEIVLQAKEINSLLLSNNITPIFLKGTGNLLDNLYIDIAERMIGDIDILVADTDFKKAVKIMEKDGYLKDDSKIDTVFLNRHYPKIVKKNKLGALEIHYRMLLNPYDKDFNYQKVKDSIKKTEDNISVLSNENQIILTSFNRQINDRGTWFKTLSIRSSYDLFLLSIKTSPLKTFKEFHNYFIIFNNFIASSSLLFNNPKCLLFEKNIESDTFLKKLNLYIENPSKQKKNKKIWSFYFRAKTTITVVFRSIFYKTERDYILKRIFG